MPDTELLGGRYEVVRTVSRGRRASVLQAIDREHDRPVALKVYPVTDVDRDELLSEARVLMNITPHAALPVVRGDFYTEDRDRYVVVMNWVEGTDLQQVLEDEGDPALPFQEVVEDLAHVAGALDHLHAQDPPIVHGDVKPANLVRTEGGRVVLVDFDIAGAQAGAERIGTLGFVAPEVAAGEKPGPSTDVYGLAATAVALLNGRPPTEEVPTYPGLPPGVHAQVARVLRAGLASDPARRPRSAGRLVENLRAAASVAPPSGVVALLSTEVADAARLWVEEPEEMRAAMARLRDVRDEVIDKAGGRVVTSMNEGDRSIAVFREASSAARAALQLHERLAQEALPPGMDLRLRAAVAVGEASLIEGVYTGAVVDHVVRLRATAEPGTTITSEPTAEMLVGLVGSDMSIVPLGAVTVPGLTDGTSLFALTPPGAERPARVRPSEHQPQPAVSPPEPERVPAVSRRAAMAAAAQHPSTLVAATSAGVALIYLIVLSPELGMTGLASAAVFLALTAAVGSFWWHYATGCRVQRQQIEADRRERELGARVELADRERREFRAQLARGFARIDSEEAGGRGALLLEQLGDEADAVAELLRRGRERVSMRLTSLLPGLAEETYRHGMSALSDALQLLEFADGPHRRRLEGELEDVEGRLARDAYPDERERARDEQRHASHRELVARQDAARQRARDLMFEAERCVAALAETRIELASVRADDTQIDVDVVVQTLQDTIRQVREVQDELRRLGY